MKPSAKDDGIVASTPPPSSITETPVAPSISKNHNIKDGARNELASFVSLR